MTDKNLAIAMHILQRYPYLWMICGIIAEGILFSFTKTADPCSSPFTQSLVPFTFYILAAILGILALAFLICEVSYIIIKKTPLGVWILIINIISAIFFYILTSTIFYYYISLCPINLPVTGL